MANGDRGQIKQIVLTIQYPDNSTKTVRVDPSDISKLILKPKAGEPLPSGWSTPDWRNNPTFIVERDDGSISGACSTVHHPPGDEGPP